MAAYLQIASMTAQIYFAYRMALAIELVATLLRIFLLKMIWTSVYGDQTTVDGRELHTVIAFVTLANLQFWLIFPGTAQWIAEDVSSGKIALELARPVVYIRGILMRQLGASGAVLPFVLAGTVFAFWVGGLAPPASAAAALLYLLSAGLAFVVVSAFGLVLGLTAFWTTEIWGFMTIRYFVAQFFAGALVPIWFFPGWLRAIADVLPFQAELHIPLSIYFGQMTGEAAIRGLTTQLFWAAALSAVAVFMWQRAVRKLTVQGG